MKIGRFLAELFEK